MWKKKNYLTEKLKEKFQGKDETEASEAKKETLAENRERGQRWVRWIAN